jgi:hypothetical protein
LLTTSPIESHPILALFLLAMPIASITWTLTHEEIVSEFRDYCVSESQICRKVAERKFFYIFTCEYCLSHYVTVAVLVLSRYRLLFPDWRGYVIAGFSLVWIANVYMGVFGKIRLDLKKRRIEIKSEESKSGGDV